MEKVGHFTHQNLRALSDLRACEIDEAIGPLVGCPIYCT